MCVKTNKLNIFQFCRKDLPPHEASGVKMCVVVLCPGHRRELLGFPCKQKKRISRRIRSGEFWTFPGLGALKASEDFRTFSLFVIQISLIMWTHNFHAQFYAVCASMCWMKEKKQRWICILYDFSTSASHHGKHAHYICTFFPHFFFGAKRQSLRYMDIMLCSRGALGDSQVCHTLLGQSLAQRWEICFELQDFRISENYYYLFAIERVRQTVAVRREGEGKKKVWSGCVVFGDGNFRWEFLRVWGERESDEVDCDFAVQMVRSLYDYVLSLPVHHRKN